MTFIKNFLNWFELKLKIDSKITQAPLFDEGQIWWAFLGENIGTEISGKGEKFARPCIIYKKFSRHTFMIIPCSTQIKEGSWFVKFVHNQKEQIAVLSQARVIDYRRLHNKVGALDQVDFQRIKSQFLDLLK